MENVQPLFQTVWQFLIKLNIYLTYCPAVPLLGIYTREMEVDVHVVTRAQTCTGALFLTAKNYKRANVLKWVGNRLWYSQNLEYYSSKKSARSSPTTWMDHKDVMLGERRRISKGYIQYNSILQIPNHSDREQISGCQGSGLGQAHTRGWRRDSWWWNSSVTWQCDRFRHTITFHRTVETLAENLGKSGKISALAKCTNVHRMV